MQKQHTSQFIETIWQIVSDPNTDSIIRWNSNGTSFVVTNTQLFASDIIPKHFSHSNLSSFIRQLNMYNFHKRKTEHQQLEFHHQLFRRAAKELLTAIKRKPSQADIHQGEQLLKLFLQRTAHKEEPPHHYRNQDSNHLTIEHDRNKQALENAVIEAFKPKIIKNIIVVSPKPFTD